MTTTAAPQLPATLAVSEAFAFVPPATPDRTCPDGSGDLWWDDASYVRYQSEDPYAGYPDADDLVLLLSARDPGRPQYGLELVPANYCSGDAWACTCHAAAAEAAAADWADVPF